MFRHIIEEIVGGLLFPLLLIMEGNLLPCLAEVFNGPDDTFYIVGMDLGGCLRVHLTASMA